MAGHLLQTYNRLPVKFIKGKGSWLFDQNNDKYLDALCGIAVTSLGHSHPKFTEAIIKQAEKLIHLSNLVEIPEQELLADMLVESSGIDGHVFFNNSGAEAVETAIKLARLHGNAQSLSPGKIIVMESAFHGRTMATLTASGSRKVHAGFEPLVQGFIRAPYNDIDAIRNIAENDKSIVAVLLEPIQGEGGIFPGDAEYLKQVRELCTQNKWLMMADEIQCGIGRTGTIFGYQHASIKPDVVIMAKALGNGIPIGACLISKEWSSLFKPGSHGSTFGGNPLSSTAGIKTLEIIKEESLLKNADEKGKMILQGLKESLSNHPNVVDIRGKGLMIGVELDKPCRDILKLALEEKIIFNIARDKVVRLLPPLNISDNEAAMIVDKISKLVKAFYS